MIQSLAQIGSASAAPAIVQSATLAAEEFGTSMAIYDALRAFGPRLEAAPFLEMLGAADIPEVMQGFAVEALGHARDPKSFDVLARLVADRRLMLQAVQALGRLGDPRAIPVLAQLIGATDIDENRRIQAAGELGRLQHPSAFPVLERYVRRRRPRPAISTIEAVAAVGRDRALPVLRELWIRESSLRKHILKALTWIATPAATVTVLELMDPPDVERISLLVNAVGHADGLFFVGARRNGPIDERVLSLIDQCFERLSPEVQRAAVWALERESSPASLHILERVAADSRYAVPMTEVAGDTRHSIRDWALQSLAHMGSPVAIEAVLEELAPGRLGIVEHRLARMNRSAVVTTLRRSVRAAAGDGLVSLLRLLGWFGDVDVLPDVRAFLDDADGRVANAAYEAEQRILGLADID